MPTLKLVDQSAKSMYRMHLLQVLNPPPPPPTSPPPPAKEEFRSAGIPKARFPRPGSGGGKGGGSAERRQAKALGACSETLCSSLPSPSQAEPCPPPPKKNPALPGPSPESGQPRSLLRRVRPLDPEPTLSRASPSSRDLLESKRARKLEGPIPPARDSG